MPAEIAARVKKAKGKDKKPVRSYVTFSPKGKLDIERVDCKDCGEPIRALVEDERFEESREINGKLIIYKRLILASLPSYEEITIQFDDGTKHVTGMCKSCLDTLTVDDLEAVYAADLLQWEEEEKQGGGKVRWDLYGKRKPVGFVRGG